MDDLVKMTVPLVGSELSLMDDPEGRIGIMFFVAGCPRRCEGCQNPELQSADGVKRVPLTVILDKMVENRDFVEVAIFLGGDWLLYPEEYDAISYRLMSMGFKNILFTGAKFEDIHERIVQNSEYIIDGPWEKDKPGIFPASTNQRVFKNGIQIDPRELPIYLAFAELGATDAKQR